MTDSIRLALNADTTPLSISDTLIFKPLEERAREAAESGFTAVNVDRGEPGLTPDQVREILNGFHVGVASGFFQGPFYRASEEKRILGEALAQARFSQAIGQDCLFVSTTVAHPERHAVVGRVHAAHPVSLTDGEFRQTARLLESVASIWMESGITLCYHPHVATYIEAPHEIARLMEETDPRMVHFGPDTGHLLFGGGEPLEIIDRYFSRVRALHIKDVRRQVVEEVRARQLDYRQACALGVWTELGSGDVDFPALFQMLRDRRWGGWVIVETDHTRLPTALESSRLSRRYLREVVGI